MKEGNKERQGILNKFLSVLSGKPEGASEERVDSEWIPLENDPVDLHFAKVFCADGGNFLYAEDPAAEEQYLAAVFGEIGRHRVFCPNLELRTRLSKAGLELEYTDAASAAIFVTACDFLVAYNGGIMLTAKHTEGRKLNELPSVVLVLAQTDQLVLKLNQALTGIRNRYSEGLPSQITTLHGPNHELESVSAANAHRKELFLLLTETAL